MSNSGLLICIPVLPISSLVFCLRGNQTILYSQFEYIFSRQFSRKLESSQPCLNNNLTSSLKMVIYKCPYNPKTNKFRAYCTSGDTLLHVIQISRCFILHNEWIWKEYNIYILQYITSLVRFSIGKRAAKIYVMRVLSEAIDMNSLNNYYKNFVLPKRE